MDHIQSSTASPQVDARSSIFDISLASLHLATAQSIRQVAQDAMGETGDTPRVLDLDISTVDMIVKNLYFKYSRPSSRPSSLHLSFTEWTSGVGTVHAFDDACHLSLGQCAVSIHEGSISACLADIHAETNDRAIEHILATAACILRSASFVRPTPPPTCP